MGILDIWDMCVAVVFYLNFIIIVGVDGIKLIVVEFRKLFIVVISLFFVVRVCLLGGSSGMSWDLGIDGFGDTELELSLICDSRGAIWQRHIQSWRTGWRW